MLSTPHHAAEASLAPLASLVLSFFLKPNRFLAGALAGQELK